MPDVDEMVEALDGFDVKILVAVRSPYPLAKSEENFRDLESLDAAYDRILTAYRHIFQEVQPYDFLVIPYEGLARNQARICDRLGLNEPDVDVYDGNAKYFE